jgi:hypothetical protein
MYLGPLHLGAEDDTDLCAVQVARAVQVKHAKRNVNAVGRGWSACTETGEKKRCAPALAPGIQSGGLQNAPSLFLSFSLRTREQLEKEKKLPIRDAAVVVGVGQGKHRPQARHPLRIKGLGVYAHNIRDVPDTPRVSPSVWRGVLPLRTCVSGRSGGHRASARSTSAGERVGSAPATPGCAKVVNQSRVARSVASRASQASSTWTPRV